MDPNNDASTMSTDDTMVADRTDRKNDANSTARPVPAWPHSSASMSIMAKGALVNVENPNRNPSKITTSTLNSSVQNTTT